LKAEAKVLGSQARALERSLELVAEANSPDGINCGETEFVEVTSITGGGGGLVSDQTVHRASAMAYDKKVMEDARTVTVSEDTSTGGINITTVVTVLPGVALPLPRGDFTLLTSLCREEQLQGHLLEELHRAVRLRERSEAVAREVNGRRRQFFDHELSEHMQGEHEAEWKKLDASDKVKKFYRHAVVISEEEKKAVATFLKLKRANENGKSNAKKVKTK
jgi:hypothetical protein